MSEPHSPDDQSSATAGSGLAADTAACFRFFSRLPFPRLGSWDSPAAVPDFVRIARAAPLAGVAVALPAAAIGFLLGFTSLPPLVVGLLMTAALAAATGALHEDGLADVTDGFFGGHTAEKRLDIMKDSRIGSFGAMALIVAVGVRAALLGELLARFGPGGGILIFLGTEALSRTLLVWQWSILPSARPDGLGARFGKPDQKAANQATLLGAACVVPAALVVPVPALLTGLLLAALAAIGLGRLSVQKIGGFTGDVLGAIQQVTSLAFLIGCLAVP